MSEAANLLSRYLRQRREIGEVELIFDGRPLTGLAALSSESNQVVTTDPVPARSAEPEALGAPSSSSLDGLKVIASGCTACGLAETRSTVVFGEGNPHAEVVIVGEAPGAEEDRSGRPFVGRAGKLLDVLLASVGFPRETVYICNVLKCRPPANRNPRPEEVEACSPFLKRQLEMIAPKAILACGTFSAQTLLSSGEAIGKLRSGSHVYQGIPLVATYHPAALLRNPAWIRPVWEDLQKLRETVDSADHQS